MGYLFWAAYSLNATKCLFGGFIYSTNVLLCKVETQLMLKRIKECGSKQNGCDVKWKTKNLLKML